jgi:hypothetical protein
LVIKTSVETNQYAKGTKITDDEIQALALERDAFHGEWNYTLHPRALPQHLARAHAKLNIKKPSLLIPMKRPEMHIRYCRST